MTETRREISVAGLNEPLSHYTDAVVFGQLVFVSGCGPLDEHGRVVSEGDVAGQARHVLSAIGKILEQAGSGLQHVLKVTVYLTDTSDRPLINPVRQEFFRSARPACTLVEV